MPDIHVSDTVLRETLATVLKRSAADSEFRALCLADAARAVRSVCPEAEPQPELRFVEQEWEQGITLPPLFDSSPVEELEFELAKAGKGKKKKTRKAAQTETGSAGHPCNCRTICV